MKEVKGPVGEIQASDRLIYAVEQNKVNHRYYGLILPPPNALPTDPTPPLRQVLVPGNCNRYLAWGFADQSFRLGTYDTDKAVFVCEPNYLVGEVCFLMIPLLPLVQVLTCVCPNPRLVLTAGTSSVVCVWVYHKKVKQLHLRHSLYGHTDAVTCLAARCCSYSSYFPRLPPTSTLQSGLGHSCVRLQRQKCHYLGYLQVLL